MEALTDSPWFDLIASVVMLASAIASQTACQWADSRTLRGQEKTRPCKVGRVLFHLTPNYRVSYPVTSSLLSRILQTKGIHGRNAVISSPFPGEILSPISRGFYPHNLPGVPDRNLVLINRF